MQAYAVISSGGKQHNVKAGDVLRVELLDGKNEGDTVEIPVLAAKSETDFKVGAPELSEKASATIVGQEKGDKVLVFKKRKRQTYKRKNGHRQNFHVIRIDSIPS